jgi:hypothetical protein
VNSSLVEITGKSCEMISTFMKWYSIYSLESLTTMAGVVQHRLQSIERILKLRKDRLSLQFEYHSILEISN